jgi:hypothetical protein
LIDDYDGNGQGEPRQRVPDHSKVNHVANATRALPKKRSVSTCITCRTCSVIIAFVLISAVVIGIMYEKHTLYTKCQSNLGECIAEKNKLMSSSSSKSLTECQAEKKKLMSSLKECQSTSDGITRIMRDWINDVQNSRLALFLIALSLLVFVLVFIVSIYNRSVRTQEQAMIHVSKLSNQIKELNSKVASHNQIPAVKASQAQSNDNPCGIM